MRSRCEARRPHTLLQQLVAREHASLVECQRVEEPELGRRQVGAGPVHVCLDVARIEPELLDVDLLAAARLLRARAASGGGGDPGDELLHRERLDEVVVRAELERVDPVVLGSARADDDDRGADALAARLLDHAPTVDAGEHQVEDADVGLLVAEPGQAGLAVRDRHRVQTGGAEVARHALGDHVVVLDDRAPSPYVH